MPLPPGPPFIGVRVRFSAPFDRLRAPHPDGEHAGQREGKDVLVLLRWSSWGILEYGWARCGLLYDDGRGDWGLNDGSSTGGGFCLLTGETCAQRLAPGTTCVARLTINPARSFSAPLHGDAKIQPPTIRCLGDAAALWRNGPWSPLDSNLYGPAKDLGAVFPVDVATMAQFGRAPLASLPAPTFGPVPLRLDPSSELPTTCIWRGH